MTEMILANVNLQREVLAKLCYFHGTLFSKLRAVLQI